jgi:hemoglobin
MDEAQVYEVIGEDGFARLVRAFYAQVPEDELLGPMYPADDLPGAEARLRDFLVGRFGGPARYIEQRAAGASCAVPGHARGPGSLVRAHVAGAR